MRQSFRIVAFAVFAWTPMTLMSSAAHLQPSSAKPADTAAIVSDVGELGENIYDWAKDRQWTKATGALTSLKKQANALRSRLQDAEEANKQLTNTIAVLEKAVGAKDRQATMLKANRITLIAAGLSEQYHPQIPADIARLDYYGRELEIWSAAKNATKLKETARALEKTWAGVLPSVRKHGGAKQAKTFDKLVSRLAAARSPQEYGHICTQIMDEVDHLEAVYTK